MAEAPNCTVRKLRLIIYDSQSNLLEVKQVKKVVCLNFLPMIH